MEVEKRGVKGGLFQLFDWTGKSRKKLFSTKSELPESSNQGKENHSSVVARQQELEKGFPPNARSQNDYFGYASSTTSDDSEYGTKAPGVVARLMGLDSLPMQNVNEPCLTPIIESHSCSDSSYLMAASTLQREHDIVIFESVRNKLDGLSRNPLNLKLQRVQSRPIERFQKEVLPPKSAKPISIPQHRLLSPIKSPGFVPPKNAAYIIEAAAKMIEQSPLSNTKGNHPSVGSSSVPFRIRDLKEKMEAARRSSQLADASRRSKEKTNVMNMKKQLNARDQGQSESSYLPKGSEESKRGGSKRLKSKEKSVSLAPQAKANIQKRDRLTSVGNRSSEKQKEHKDVKSSHVTKNLTSIQKKMEKHGPSMKSSEVLRQNNQKQNCAFTEDGEITAPLYSHSEERKEPKMSSYRQGRMNRTVNKIVVDDVVSSRKTNFVAANPGKELSLSKAKTTSKKKLPVNGNNQSGGIVGQKTVMRKDEKSVKCNVTFEGDSKWDGIDKKNNLDVVSFTFSSPMKKSGVGSKPFGYSVTGGDALSVLLEQKLEELTSMVELSQKAGSSKSVNSCGSISSTANSVNSLPVDGDICENKQDTWNSTECPPIDKVWVKAEKESEASLSVSSQPSLSRASSDSFDVDRSSCNEGQFPCSLLESYEGTNWSSTGKYVPAECDVEMSDTAASLSVGTMSATITSSLCTTDSKDPCCWELHYIGDMLGSADLLWEEFALGQAHKVIAPGLFDWLENQKIDTYKVTEEHFVLERKVLFDCVCECLEVRCERLLAGSCRYWAKQKTVLHRRRWLAEDLYREISSWTNEKELMVDELVDKDMSSKNGKWLDFETEAFEEGVEIEKRILTSLVDELIDDLLF